MIIYWSAAIISMIMAWLYRHILQKDNRYVKSVMYILIALPLMYISAVRYYVGTDYGMYRYIFESAAIGRNITFSSKTFLLFDRIIHQLGGNFFTSVAIISIIFMMLITISIMENSPYPEISIFLFFTMGYYFQSMNIMRQMMGVSILLFSLKFVRERKLIPFIICVILATGFHSVCIIFIAVYFLYGIKINIKWALAVTPILFLGSLLTSSLINRLIQFTRFTNYIGNFSGFVGIRAYLGLAINLAIFIWGTMVYSQMLFYSEEENYQYLLYGTLQILTVWVSVLLMGVRANYNQIARIQYIFSIGSIVYIPLLIRKIPKRLTKLFVIAVVLIYGIANCTYAYGMNNQCDVLPYKNIFSSSILR